MTVTNTATNNPAPVARVATTLEAYAGYGQSGQTGTALVVAPSVVVKDNFGAVMPGVTVRFAVVSGGGSIEASLATTDAAGVATAGKWTLGSAAGSNELSATVGSLPSVRFTATAIAAAVPPPSTSAYAITVRYVATPTARQQLAVTRAIAKWQSAITRDLSDIPLNAAAATCFPAQPAVKETIDDMLIYVEFVPIDGAGKTLGEAGPCYIRNDNSLPIMGHLKLDTDDLAMMEANGTIDDVVSHEIGHILGIGTLWSTKGLLTGATTPDPVFTGFNATSAFAALGGTGSVPVENTGDTGTRDGHWRESVFNNELMTGWINLGSNPLSAMTIASLTDMGYGANTSVASGYTLGGSRNGAMAGIQIEGHERVKEPKFKTDKAGRNTRLID